MVTPARKIAAAIGLATNGPSVKASQTPKIEEAEARASSRDVAGMQTEIEKLAKVLYEQL